LAAWRYTYCWAVFNFSSIISSTIISIAEDDTARELHERGRRWQDTAAAFRTSGAIQRDQVDKHNLLRVFGGLYARQLAKMAPDRVRQVITLGSPFAGDPRSTNAWRITSGRAVNVPKMSIRNLPPTCPSRHLFPQRQFSAERMAYAPGEDAASTKRLLRKVSKSTAAIVEWDTIRRVFTPLPSD
jgi:hypothetical protein